MALTDSAIELEQRISGALGRLAGLSSSMLQRMIVTTGENRDLFCFRLRQNDAGEFEKDGASPRYTAITLLGTASAWGSAVLKEEPWLPAVRALGRLLEQRPGQFGIGDLGLLLWLDEYLDGIWTRRLEQELSSRRVSGAACDAMDWAWLLTGATLNKSLATRESWIHQSRDRLLECYHPETRIFSLRSSKNRMRASGYTAVLGSFASQVYPIFALSAYAGEFRDRAIIRLVGDAARSVCSLQGLQGQWWWIFDARTGAIALDYPVYSVHQDGMAPMALLAATRVTGSNDYLPALQRGLDHLFRYHDARTGDGFIDEAEKMIWRAVIKDKPGEDPAILPFGLYQTEMRWVSSQGRPRLFRGGAKIAAADHRLLKEARPYCAGWILFAYGLACKTFGFETAARSRSGPLPMKHSLENTNRHE